MAATPTASKAKTTKVNNSLSARLLDVHGKEAGQMDLPAALFAVKASDRLLSQYVRVYLANQRQGTATAKTRGEVQATTKKVYRQKGTGRARHGARTAALFVGGGVTHGPQARDFSLRLNKKQKSKALLCALSLKAQGQNVLVVQGIAGLDAKTKAAAGMFKAADLDNKKVLFVYAPDQAENMRKANANLSYVKGAQDKLLNAYDVLCAQTVLFTKEALEDFITFRKAA